MALTVGAVDAIRTRLAAIPQKDESAREVTRVEALVRMRGEILALREGGYSWEELAEIVSREGCRVTVATLKTELSRRAATPKGKKGKRGEGGSRTGGRSAAIRDQPDEVVAGAKASVTVGSPPPRPKTVPDAPAGTFVVREDSEI